MVSSQSQLFTLIQATRRRRQQLLALRGVALMFVFGAAVLLLFGWMANRYRFELHIVNYLRASALLSLLGGLYLLLIRPLAVRVSNRRLARFIEERRPDASDRFVTAVEIAEGDLGTAHSWAVTQRLVREADEYASRINVGEIIPTKRLAAYLGIAAACLIFFMGALVLGPRGLLQGVKQLVAPAELTAQTGESQVVSVTPGNARVPRGSDQQIRATLAHINSETVTLFTRTPEGESETDGENVRWQGQLMEADKDAGEFQFMIFNIQNTTEYFVESGGVRSETYRLDVVDLPFVKQLDLTLSYPSYTRLSPKTIEDGGEVAAVKGSSVRVLAKLTGKVKSARLVLSNGRKTEMRPEGETDFSGSLIVAGEASYYIELTSVDGEVYRGSNEHDIVALEDQAPTVSFEKPGRDMRATNLEEVFTQVKAEDDYGVSSVELFFSINGQAEQKVNLQQLSRDAENALRGTHTFFMEEFGLKPGDFVSYYAKARDASREATSDIYFIEVKPFEMQYKQAQQQGGGGGGGGGEDQNALTRRQKDLIAATFRLMKEDSNYSATERASNFATISQGQEKLRADTNNFIDRLKRRLGDQLEGQEQLVEMVNHLEQAAREMAGALAPLQKQSSRDALPPEQRALQQLLSADSILREMQVANNSQSGESGEGREQSQELSQLFELELDKMKNQYETLKREQRQQPQPSQGAKSEVERKLEELARRQQKMLEQQQQRRQQQQQAGSQSGGGGSSERQQQELIEETRKTARELERLSRERRDPKMQEMSRQLNQAADEMQQAQAAAQNNESGQASAQTQRALERLEQARRRLQNSRQSGSAQETSELRRRAAEAAARQREIVRDLEKLSERNGQSGEAQGAKKQLTERKDALADAVKNLEQDLDKTAQTQEAGGDGKGRGGKELKDAASQLRRDQVSDQIRRNNQNIEKDQYGAAKGTERAVQQNLDQLAERLRRAEQAGKNQAGAGAEEALDRTRQLADDLESLKRRMDENARRNKAQGQKPGQQQQQQARSQQGQQQGRQQQGGQQQQGQEGQQQGQSGGRANEGRAQQQGAAQGSSQGGNDDSRAGSNDSNQGGDSRQIWSELRERLGEAEDLRRQFGREGGSSTAARDFDSVVRQMRELSARGGMEGEAQTAALLKAQVIEPLRQLELELSRRQQAKNGERAFTLGDEGTAPERYRKYVDEYYKRLSNRAARKR